MELPTGSPASRRRPLPKRSPCQPCSDVAVCACDIFFQILRFRSSDILLVFLFRLAPGYLSGLASRGSRVLACRSVRGPTAEARGAVAQIARLFRGASK